VSAEEVGEFDLGAGAGVEPVAPTVAERLKESTAIIAQRRESRPCAARRTGGRARPWRPGNRWRGERRVALPYTTSSWL